MSLSLTTLRQKPDTKRTNGDVATFSRNVNLERLADMAKPKKRGGAPDSWAVTARAQKVGVGRWRDG